MYEHSMRIRHLETHHNFSTQVDVYLRNVLNVVPKEKGTFVKVY